MKLLLILMTQLLLSGCLGTPKQSSPGAATKAPKDPVESSTTAAVVSVPYSSRNYLEMNDIYSRITGIGKHSKIIRDTIGVIKSQLPADSNPMAYSSFNQIAITTLALVYCELYFTTRPGQKNPLPGAYSVDILNELSLPLTASYTLSSKLQTWETIKGREVDALLGHFFNSEDSDPQSTARLRSELLDAIETRSDRSSLISPLPLNSRISHGSTILQNLPQGQYEVRAGLTSACGTLLASSYFTMD